MHANVSLEAQMPFPVALMSRLLVSLISALLSVSLVYGLMKASIPEPWWRQAGLQTDPGYFRGANIVDYPFCQAWNDYQGGDRMARDLGAPGVRVTAAQTRTAIRPGGEENLLVELPGTAQIVAVYCGISQDRAPMGECARYVCGDGVATFIADSLYTGSEVSGTLQNGNRILTLTLMNKRAETRRRTTVRFWVAWKDDAPPPQAIPASPGIKPSADKPLAGPAQPPRNPT